MSDLVLLARAWRFAAQRHAGQQRKGSSGEPYVNHLAEVAELVAEASARRDADLVAAAVLHDTLEKTATTRDELVGSFNEAVAALVEEVTDDPDLSEDERKQQQVDSAPHKSAGAKLIKLGDKISNLRGVTADPPADWSAVEHRAWLDWTARVAAGLRGTSARLDRLFEEAYRTAEQRLEERGRIGTS